MSSNHVLIERNIWINAAPAAVRLAFNDISETPCFFPRTTLVCARGAASEPDSALVIRYQIAGLTFDLHLLNVEVTPASQVIMLSISNAQFLKPVPGKLSWLWQEHGGGTQMSLMCEYEVPNDWLVQEMERWMIRSLNTDHVEIGLENAKRWIESAAT